MNVVGQSVIRTDLKAKATGQAVFARDLQMPGMLHMKLVFAGRPHARISAIDTGRAAGMPGVRAIFTAQDVPHNAYGLLIADQPVFCDQVVRFVGDRVAAVVAETLEQAAAAAAAVVVHYDDLPVVADPWAGLAQGAPVLHAEHPDNVLRRIRLRRGDAAAAMTQAEYVVERTYFTPAQEHAYLEPEAGLGYIDEQGRVTVHAAGQCIDDDLRQIAEALALPADRVRVIYGPVGGAFGGREDVSVQIVLALAAARLRTPVKIAWTRTESIIAHTKRHPITIKHRWGADRNGKVLAAQIEVVTDVGAYASTSGSVLENFVFAGTGAYDIPNVSIDGVAVYTNNVSTGACRGFGAPQAAFASELQIAHLAEASGIDPITLRLRNCLRTGSLLATQTVVPGGVILPELIETCARAAGFTESTEGWRAPAQPAAAGSQRRGVGLAIAMKNAGFGIGAPEGARARVVLRGAAEIEQVEVHVGAAEVGQGAHSTMAQIAAECLNVPIERVTVWGTDTSDIAGAGAASASRLTFVAGNAVAQAAQQALARWRDEERPASVEVQYNSPRTVGPDPVTGACIGADTVVSLSYAAQAVKVEVDTDTGEVRLLRVFTAQDPGRAVNPQQVRAQMQGGIIQAQGWSLMENFVTQGGRVLSDRLSTYLIPTIGDVPAAVECHLLEDPDPRGPLGARGVGELPHVPLAPAIVCAVHDATGVWFDRLPLTPEMVWQGLQAAGSPIGTARSA